MSNNKRTGSGLFGKGYYIALVLCAAAIGITGYLYYRNADATETMVREDPAGDTVSATLDQGEDIPVLATQPKSTLGTDVTETTEATNPKILKTAAPVAGELTVGYSMEALSYNQTTRDWRVHDGVDIAAEAGTQVLAAADGEVYTLYEDDTMGMTVVIRHEGGYTTTYASLEKDLAVKVGDKVEMGQAIGVVGETALVETVLGPHVHFGVTYRDVPMDPAEFLNLG